MDRQDLRKYVRDKLSKAGHTDLSDDTLESFLDHLESKNRGTTSTKRAKSSNPKKRARQPRQPVQVDHENEAADWMSRIQRLQRKALSLDAQLQACTEICQDRSKSPGPPLYRFNYENFKDPYPVIDPAVSGQGFIHPPHILAARGRFPIYKKDLCYPPPDFIKQLRASERGPQYYIPDRNNRLEGGYKLRERMAYSHPDYH